MFLNTPFKLKTLDKLIDFNINLSFNILSFFNLHIDNIDVNIDKRSEI